MRGGVMNENVNISFNKYEYSEILNMMVSQEVQKMNSLKIAIDADGTLFTAEGFPHIGEDIGAIPVLKKIVNAGHRLILNTVRDGRALMNVVDWLKENGIALHGVNKLPRQDRYSSSPKIDADVFIDDKNIDAHLIYPKSGGKPYVNWTWINAELIKRKII